MSVLTKHSNENRGKRENTQTYLALLPTGRTGRGCQISRCGAAGECLGIWYFSWRGLGDFPYGGCDMEAVSAAVLLHLPIEALKHKGRQVEVRSRCR